MPGLKVKKGLLMEVKDSSVILARAFKPADYENGVLNTEKVDVKNINVIKVRRKGAEAAILIGGISGMVIGGVLMAAYEQSLRKTQDPLEHLFIGTMQATIPFFVSTAIGLGTGLICAAKISIPVHGSQESYSQVKNNLNRYAMLNNPYLTNIPAQSFSRLRDSVTDIEGNVYHTLALGGQVWLDANLRVGRYNNGDSIPVQKGQGEWASSANGASCWYRNRTEGSGKYGMIYNWNAVHDSRGLCPKGWHVPSPEEWASLVNCLGGGSSAGTKLGQPVNRPASDGSTLNLAGGPFATPGGFRFSGGEFSPVDQPSCQWWTSGRQDSTQAKAVQLDSRGSSIFFTGSDMRSGLSVRCIRD